MSAAYVTDLDDGGFPWGRAALVLALVLAAHALALSLAQRTTVVAPQAPQVTVLDAVLLAPPPPPPVPQAKPAPPPVVRAPRPRPKPVATPPPPPSPVVEAPVENPPLAPVDVAPALPAAPAESIAPDAAAAAEAGSEPVAPEATGEGKTDVPFDWAAALADAGGPALPAAASYVYRTRMSRLSIVTATTTTRWSRADAGSYEASLEAEAIGRTILRLSSSGTLGPRGLEPQRYGQRSMNRPERVASIDRVGQRVRFAAREVPFEGPLQDRLSFQFQLMALAQRMPERIVPGARIVFPVAGPDEIEDYLFVVEAEREPYTVGERTVETVRLQRQRERKGRMARIEVWMAPELLWAPVRLRFTEADGTIWDNQLLSVESAQR